jgi:hypothetical protein
MGAREGLHGAVGHRMSWRPTPRGVRVGPACLAVAASALFVGVGTSSAAASGKFDARWSALQACLVTAERNLPSNQGGPGKAQTVSPGLIHVFFDRQPRYAGFTAAFSYEGTFARAEAAAKGIRKQRHALGGVGTAAGLAIGNVTYYFTGWASSPQLTLLTDCLVKTYAGQPRWPANVDPRSLADESGSKPWTVK